MQTRSATKTHRTIGMKHVIIPVHELERVGWFDTFRLTSRSNRESRVCFKSRPSRVKKAVVFMQRFHLVLIRLKK